MLESNVEQALVGEEKHGDAAGAGQIDLIEPRVLVVFTRHLSLAEPLEVQRQDAVPGEVDAALLDVVDRNAGAFMTIQVDHNRNTAAQLRGLV
jgi:hypothetical protein